MDSKGTKRSVRYMRLQAFFNRFKPKLTGTIVGKKVIIDNRTIDAILVDCDIAYLGGSFHIEHMETTGKDSSYWLHGSAECTVSWMRAINKAVQNANGLDNFPVAVFGREAILTAAARLQEPQLEITVTKKDVEQPTLNELLKATTAAAQTPPNTTGVVNSVLYTPALVATLPRLVPVYREESARYFADPADIEPWMDPSGVMTSALRFGVRMDLLGLSQRIDLISQGVQDSTDCLDSAISLDKLYGLYEGKIYQVDVADMATTAFTFDTAGDPTQMALNYNGAVILGITDTKRVAVSVDIKGQINTQYGTVELFSFGSTEVKWFGYTLKTTRVNPNRKPLPVETPKFAEGEYPVDVSHAR